MDLTEVLEVVRLTNVGLVREHNEDAIASDETLGLVVLADGIGGYKAGEVASEIAVLSITAEIKEAMELHRPGKVDPVLGKQSEARLILSAVKSANELIYAISQNQEQCSGMGTTLLVGLFTNNKLLVGHIGDSRMYRFRNQDFIQITEDHSLLQEQINLGLITTGQAGNLKHKHLVTRALGVNPEVKLDLNEFDVEVNDIYLLCSDGLSDLVEGEDIIAILNKFSSNLDHAAQMLVQLANDNGGYDNISVILIRVKESFEYKGTWRDGSGVEFFLGWFK